MKITHSIYETLTDEEDTRLCRDISDHACRETPQSFVLILASNALTKLGDAIANPKTTLAWITTMIGAPAFVLGMLVPIRESGSMMPQIFLGGLIRRQAVRKWTWVAGSLGQAACVVAIGFVALTMTGGSAGWAILGLVSLFSLFRGFCSVAAKDVLGKVIPKPRRGQLAGWSASFAGLLGIGIGVTLMLPLSGGLDDVILAALLFGAGALWLVGAAIYARVPEYPGETDGGRSLLDALASLQLIVSDKPFRQFVTARALLMCSALSAPFYVALAQREFGSPAYLLGAFIVAAGLAELVSAPFWGRFADSSSRLVMRNAALITSGSGLLVFVVFRYFPGVGEAPWFLPLTYFVLSLAHSGVRIGRKTYVVNMATGNQRTEYVAVSNTIIGVALLFVGSIGALASRFGNDGVIALLALMGLAGALLTMPLADVED